MWRLWHASVRFCLSVNRRYDLIAAIYFPVLFQLLMDSKWEPQLNQKAKPELIGWFQMCLFLGIKIKAIHLIVSTVNKSDFQCYHHCTSFPSWQRAFWGPCSRYLVMIAEIRGYNMSHNHHGPSYHLWACITMTPFGCVVEVGWMSLLGKVHLQRWKPAPLLSLP